MTDHLTHNSDDWLLSELQAVLDITEPVPADALDAAYAAVEMRALDDELAALVFDSLEAAGAPAMRSTDTDVRLLSFVNDNMTLDLELHGDGHTIVGQMSPAPDGEACIEVDGGDDVVLDVDKLGRFRVTVEATSSIRFRVVGQLVTPWFAR